MPNRQTLRAQAFHAQGGHCCYCELLMWLEAPEELRAPGLSPRTVRGLQCTAEHLVARQDGGRDKRQNIAAACQFCNARRHRRKHPPQPAAYQHLVRRRMSNGRWHPVSIHRATAALAGALAT